MARFLRALRRVAEAMEGSRKILGINKRNLHYIYPLNRRRDFQIADNKLRTKEVLASYGVPMPETYRVFHHFYELADLATSLAPYRDFVVKPAMGSGGNGIFVITGRREDAWITVNGKRLTDQDLRQHIANIIFGVYSFDMHDQAIVESRLVQHPQLDVLSPFGLADIRIILHENRPALAMVRLPTRASDGKANIHQGAIGAGIDLKDGTITHAVLRGAPIARHPDIDTKLIGCAIPLWEQVKVLAEKVAAAVPLKYLGVDIALTPHHPVLLEINVRPGLQIQCANMTGLSALLSKPPNNSGVSHR